MSPNGRSQALTLSRSSGLSPARLGARYWIEYQSEYEAQLAAKIEPWERIGIKLIRSDLESGAVRLVGGNEWADAAWDWIAKKDHIQKAIEGLKG